MQDRTRFKTKLFALTAIAALAIGTNAYAGDEAGETAETNVEASEEAQLPGFNTFDTDGDGLIDGAEFVAFVDRNGWFDEVDADDDGVVVQNEFIEGSFNFWDRDDDGFIDTTEHQNVVGTWLTEDDVDFTAADTNNDNKLGPEEFGRVLVERRTYRDWDEDGDSRLTNIEYATGVVKVWDRDNDGKIDADEFISIDWTGS